MNTSAVVPDPVFVRVDHLPFSRVDDAIIAIDRDSGYCFALNSTTARIWELIATPLTVGSLCHTLCSEFDVDPETCRDDVLTILTELKDNGLVRDGCGAK
jgi:hypothetical protein